MIVEWWWSCPRCGDRMAVTHHPPDATRDRDRHLAERHPDWSPPDWMRELSRWPPGEPYRH